MPDGRIGHVELAIAGARWMMADEHPEIQVEASVEPVPSVEPVESIGDRLLALVVVARAAGVDPEQALRDAVRRVADSVRDAERG